MCIMKSYRDKSLMQKNLAVDRIGKLFIQAEDFFKEHPELSRRYVEMARKLATRYKVRFTSQQKRASCKRCNAYLKEGVNSRIRLEKGRIVQTCLECKNVRRTKYKK